MRRLRMQHLGFVQIASLAPMLLTLGCATPRGATISEKQAFVREKRDQTLADLKKIRPDVHARLSEAPGYAVFSNAHVQVIFLGGGYGYGLVTDNKTDKETFMRMAGAGVGLGLGVKDFRAVFLFKTQTALNNFVQSGWEFASQAEATAASGEKGGAVSAQAGLSDAGSSAGAATEGGGGGNRSAAGETVEIYRFTQAGIALQATIAGTKYWRDPKLNE